MKAAFEEAVGTAASVQSAAVFQAPLWLVAEAPIQLSVDPLEVAITVVEPLSEVLAPSNTSRVNAVVTV